MSSQKRFFKNFNHVITAIAKNDGGLKFERFFEVFFAVVTWFLNFSKIALIYRMCWRFKVLEQIARNGTRSSRICCELVEKRMRNVDGRKKKIKIKSAA